MLSIPFPGFSKAHRGIVVKYMYRKMPLCIPLLQSIYIFSISWYMYIAYVQYLIYLCVNELVILLSTGIAFWFSTVTATRVGVGHIEVVGSVPVVRASPSTALELKQTSTHTAITTKDSSKNVAANLEKFEVH